MRVLRLVLPLLLVCVGLCGKELVGLVTRVADGDTLTLVDGDKKRYRVRFFGIDSPESAQSMGRKAGQVLGQMVMRKNVRVEIVNKDHYGRYVGKVYLDGLYVNLEMVRLGYAWFYRQYGKGATDLEQAEQAARAAKIGIWSEPNPVAPWDFRKQKRRQKR